MTARRTLQPRGPEDSAGRPSAWPANTLFFGCAFMAAGVSIATKWMGQWGATLIGTMFLLWFFVLRIPGLFGLAGIAGAPHNPNEWSSAFIALAMWGGSWICARALSSQRPQGIRQVYAHSWRRLGPVSDGMLGDSKLSPYPPCFNSSSTCRAISFSVSNTPFPWKAIASVTGSSFRRNSLARASTGRTLGRSRLFNCST
jgi:hypothetical protein